MGKTAETIPASSSAAKSSQPFFDKKGTGFMSGSGVNASFFGADNAHPFIQTKLSIGQPNDKYEQEADAVADRVLQRKRNAGDGVSNFFPAVQLKCAECEMEEKLQKKEEGNSLEVVTDVHKETSDVPEPPPVFNESACSSNSICGPVQLKCSTCEPQEKNPKDEDAIEKDEFNQMPVQAKLTVGAPNDPFEKEADDVADQVLQKLNTDQKIQPATDPVLQTGSPVMQAQSQPGAGEFVPIKDEEKKDEVPPEIHKKSIDIGLPVPPPPNDETNLDNNPINLQRKNYSCFAGNILPSIHTKSIFESQEQPNLQRRCRECEEGDQILLKPAEILRLTGDLPGRVDGSRESIIAAAKSMLGKIEAKHADGSGKRVGAAYLLEIFHLAAPGVWDDTIIQTAGAQMPSWCGIFSVWAHKKAGKDIGNWQMGKGVSAFGTLQQTMDPLPGDIGYIDKKYQHHCIVVKVEGDTVYSIDGNSGLYSEVKENSRPRSKFSGFFTAFNGGSMVQRKEEGAAAVQPSIEDKLSSTKGSGTALPEPVQHSMGAAIGADFSNVKIHTDSNAVEMSNDLNAQAFTHGSDIYFNRGKYDPDSTGGQHLLAHELTHTVQQGAAGTASANATTQTKIQRVPAAAGALYPTTPKQVFYDGHKDDVIDIQGQSIFDPGDGLGNYISSYWETGTREVAVNIKFGDMAEGYIFVQQSGSYIYESCIGDVFGIAKLCHDVAPETYNYRSDLHVLPMKHEAFKDGSKGALVLTVQISGGIIYCKLGWVPGKSAAAIDPVMDAANVQTDEAAFLPLIYGNDYDGENYTSRYFRNIWVGGSILLNMLGELDLANQQIIGGLFIIQDNRFQFISSLIGQPIGLEKFEIPVERDDEGLLVAESTELKLDGNWTNGKKDGEDGQFALAGELRASYENGQFDIFGKASYNSARINGEVNISVSSESKAMQLFLEHAPGKRTVGADSQPSVEEKTQEPLALTAWGSLNFKLIDENKSAAAGGAPAKKSPLTGLEGKASFVVSPDGYIILAGNVKFPVNWLLTEPLDYSSTDADDTAKHLFEKKDIELGGIWVPELLSKINFTLGIQVDANAHLDPLELYEIEIAGVYSNHPSYRSEVDITPHLYIKGNAGATLVISLDGCLDALGLIPVGGVGGTLTGKATAAAFIDAAPTVRKIWEGGDKPAHYALEGIIHTGGKVDFALSGGFHLSLVKKKIAKTKDYQIGSWTLAEFGAILKLHEFILGSGAKPEFDFSKMGLTDKQRQKLGRDIVRDKESTVDPAKDKRTGGFQETDEAGKPVEKGTAFSETPIAHTDHGADVLDNNIEETFLMLGELHELILTISGTRNSPTTHIEMASGKKEPLEDKIAREKIKLDNSLDMFADDMEIKKIETQEGDLNAIKNESAKIEKDASDTAQKTTTTENPKVAGFEQLEDHISQYGKKYKTTDLGANPGTAPKIPAAPVTPLTPILISPGETLTIPFKGGKARAIFISADPEKVVLKIKSKSASGDITHGMERTVFEGWLADGKVIRWSQERERLMKNRPPYRDGLVEEVWDNAVKASPDGIVRDPNIKKVLTWDRTANRFDQWHMGHIKGAKYSDLVDTYVDGKITFDEFIKEYNLVKNYRPEDPVENMKHRWE